MTAATCTREDCTRPSRVRGLCESHYHRALRAGDRLPKLSPLERFWTKVEKSDGCWLWTGNTREGYGMFSPTHTTRRHAHRWLYETLIGPIPDGLHLDHVCHTADLSCPGGDACVHRSCVRPEHLEPVTPRENLMRSPRTSASINGAKTKCDNGHPFDEENTYYAAGRLHRVCLTCRRERRRRIRRGEAA